MGIFLKGWIIVIFSAAIPLIFSTVIISISSNDSIEIIVNHISYAEKIDYSYIIKYITFGTMHIIMCIGSTYYIYDIVKNTSNGKIYFYFIINHILSFFTAAMAFILVIFFFDTDIEIMSRDFLWICLEKIKNKWKYFLFTENINIFFYKNVTIYYFDLVPMSLVISAFLPASAVMMSIPHIINNISLSSNIYTERSISDFMHHFQYIYYNMVLLLISSTMSTSLYLNTTYSVIDIEKSKVYVNVIESIFSTWSIIYFIILIGTLLFSYLFLTNKMNKLSSTSEIISNSHSFTANNITTGYLIAKNVSLFASAFSPLAVLLVKNSFI